MLAIGLTVLIPALLIYRQLVIAMVGAWGTPSALGIVIACYALACLIHRRERGY